MESNPRVSSPHTLRTIFFGALAATPLLLLGGAQADAQVTNHNNETVVISQDTQWTGEHINIGRLVVETGVTLSAQPGAQLRIQGDLLEIFGTLSADRAGLAGGAPGARGMGGRAGSGTGAGTNGANAPTCVGQLNSGAGGGGGSANIGAGGIGGGGADANDGGCQGSAGGSGGSPLGQTPRLGAGGGGGGGAGGANAILGEPGERGGGYLIIEAHTLRVDGAISAVGGRGGTGGTSPDFFHGGGGGGGAAGGSVVITTTYLIGSGRIDASGGQGGNGGQGARVGSAPLCNTSAECGGNPCNNGRCVECTSSNQCDANPGPGVEYGFCESTTCAYYYTGAGGGGGGGGLVIIRRASQAQFQGACVVAGGVPGENTNTNSNNNTPASAGGSGACVTETVNGRPTAVPGDIYTGQEGRPVNLNGNASFDPETSNDALAFAWDCNDDGTYELTGPAVTCTFTNNGRYTVRLRVTDPQGLSDTGTATVVITEGPPTADLTGPDRADEGQSVTLDASGSDGLGDAIVRYEWNYNYAGSFVVDETTTQPTLTTTFCDNGVYNVAVRVVDDGGSTAVALHRVIVQNIPPTVTSTPPAEATEGVPYTYTVTASDPGCDTFAYQVISAPQGFTISPQGLVTWTPDFRAASEGCANVRLLVSDDDFGRVFHEWELCTTFADTDGDNLPDTWELFYGLDPSNPIDATEDPDLDGRDNLAEYRDGTSPREFDGPPAPLLSAPRNNTEIASLTPTLRSFRAVSPLGRALTYEIELYDFVNSPAELQPNLLRISEADLVPADNAPTLDWETPEEAGLEDHTAYCWRVRAFDGSVNGPWSDLWCFDINLANDPPSTPNILAPADGETVDNTTPTLTVGNCSDADGDPLTYTLIVYRGTSLASPLASFGAVPEGEQGMTSVQIEEPLDENGTYCWRAQCRDNLGASSPFSELVCFTVNQGNDQPSTPTIIAPLPGPEEERALLRETPITIVVRNAVDADGDPLVYTFEVDTALTFDTPDHLTEEVPEQRDETAWTPDYAWQDNTLYFVRVKASDGESSSGFAVTELFLNISNDPPTAPDLLTPIANTIVNSRAPALTVRNALDPDGDPLTYTFEVYEDEALTRAVVQSAPLAETPATTQLRVTNVQLADGRYFWRVKANDGTSDGPWSETGAFIIQTTATPGDNNGNNNPNNGGNPDTPTPTPGADAEDCDCSQAPGRSATLPLTALLGLLAVGAVVLLRRRR